MVKVTEELIMHLQDLAKIGLREEEKEKLKEDLQKILDYMEMLDEVNVEEVEPMYTPIEGSAPMRRDVEGVFESEGIRKNFPERDGNNLVVPPILG